MVCGGLHGLGHSQFIYTTKNVLYPVLEGVQGGVTEAQVQPGQAAHSGGCRVGAAMVSLLLMV